MLAVGILAVGPRCPGMICCWPIARGLPRRASPSPPAGSLGVTEGTLSLALAAAGMRASRTLAAVLLYRLVRFWLIALAGWLILIWLRHPWRHAGARGTGHSHDR